jgi:peptidoglycan/xylan/chitin deacetylase (PgdA/CDA1 family)
LPLKIKTKSIFRVYSLLFNKASGISMGRGFIPLILPVLVLSSIHIYTTRYGEVEKTHMDREVSIRSGNNVTILKSNEGKAMPTVNFNSRPVQSVFLARADKPLNTGDKVWHKPSAHLEPKYSAPDITRGALMKKEISITFDGGSEAAGAEEILRTLREKNVKTTIFLTGEFIKSYPKLVKEMVEDGHEIGNHSLSHPHLTTFASNYRQQTLFGVDKEFITRQLKETARIFKELTGKDMIPFWRAPYGEQNAEIRQWAYEAGFTHIGWTRNYKTKQSLDSLDWVANEESEFYHSADEIKQRILNFDKSGNEVRGGIVLMHLGTERKSSHAHTKLPEIINSLEERGYRFVKVSELLNSKK